MTFSMRSGRISAALLDCRFMHNEANFQRLSQGSLERSICCWVFSLALQFLCTVVLLEVCYVFGFQFQIEAVVFLFFLFFFSSSSTPWLWGTRLWMLGDEVMGVVGEGIETRNVAMVARSVDVARRVEKKIEKQHKQALATARKALKEKKPMTNKQRKKGQEKTTLQRWYGTSRNFGPGVALLHQVLDNVMPDVPGACISNDESVGGLGVLSLTDLGCVSLDTPSGSRGSGETRVLSSTPGVVHVSDDSTTMDNEFLAELPLDEEESTDEVDSPPKKKKKKGKEIGLRPRSKQRRPRNVTIGTESLRVSGRQSFLGQKGLWRMTVSSTWLSVFLVLRWRRRRF